MGGGYPKAVTSNSFRRDGPAAHRLVIKPGSLRRMFDLVLVLIRNDRSGAFAGTCLRIPTILLCADCSQMVCMVGMGRQ